MIGGFQLKYRMKKLCIYRVPFINLKMWVLWKIFPEYKYVLFLTLIFLFRRVQEENLSKLWVTSTHKLENCECWSTLSTDANGDLAYLHCSKSFNKSVYFTVGWKNPNPPPNPPRPDAPTPSATPSDPCRSCDHSLADHVKHLQGPNVPVSELDRLLSIVVDVENLFMCVHKEEDPDTKQVYFYLFKVCAIFGQIRKSN